jgi:hypothetical protein
LQLEIELRESHKPNFQEKLVSSGGLDIQSSKKKSIAKGKGKKTTPLKIVEVQDDLTMVDYEITTSKWDFADLHEGSKRRHSSRCLDLSLESHRPSSFQLDLSLVPSRRTLGFHWPKCCRPPSFQ